MSKPRRSPLPAPVARRAARAAALVLCAAAACVPAASARPVPSADTVLAVVSGPRSADRVRVIGAAEFSAAWDRVPPPNRPDSLTPAAARRFLDLLVDQEALSRMAARERWTWAPRDSAAYLAMRDRLVVEAMLAEEIAAVARDLGPRGDSLPGDALGLTARDRALARLSPAWDDSLVSSLARSFAALPQPSADSSVTAQLRTLGQMPKVEPRDLERPIARSAAGDYRVSDLLAGWARLNPLYRPRVQTAAQVRDLVANGLFERTLRRRGDSLDVASRPEIAARLAQQRRYFDVTRLVDREVYRRIATDSVTLARFHARTAADWARPTRVRLLRIEVGGRADAARMAGRIADPAAAESLAAAARRAGLPWTIDVAAEEDSALFARALAAGPGAVLGPDSVAGGWRVVRVGPVLPGARLAFADVRDLVERRWYGEEGERLMRELIARARRGLRVRVNEPGLAALAGGPPAGPRRPGGRGRTASR